LKEHLKFVLTYEETKNVANLLWKAFFAAIGELDQD
jgi:hypothetical protein